MSIETERAALVSVLQGIPDIGVVHTYERYAADLATLRSLYALPPVGGVAPLRGWFVQRRRTTEQRSAAKAYFDRTEWQIVGYMALKDEDQSEIFFDGLVEQIRAALRADLTLGGVVLRPEKDDTAGPTAEVGPVLFAGVLCHKATISLTTKTFQTVP